MLIEDAALAEAMERQFRLDIARSREVDPAAGCGGRSRISAALPDGAPPRGPRDRAPAALPAQRAASAAGARPWPRGR